MVPAGQPRARGWQVGGRVRARARLLAGRGRGARLMRPTARCSWPPPACAPGQSQRPWSWPSGPRSSRRTRCPRPISASPPSRRAVGAGSCGDGLARRVSRLRRRAVPRGRTTIGDGALDGGAGLQLRRDRARDGGGDARPLAQPAPAVTCHRRGRARRARRVGARARNRNDGAHRRGRPRAIRGRAARPAHVAQLAGGLRHRSGVSRVHCRLMELPRRRGRPGVPPG